MRCSKRAVQVVSITEDEASIQLCTPAPNAERLHRHASCRYIVPAIRAVTGAGLTAAQAGQHCQLNLFADNRQTHLCAAATGLLRHWRQMQQSASLKCQGCSAGCTQAKVGSSLLAPPQQRLQLPQQFTNLRNFVAKPPLSSSRRGFAASECSEAVLMKPNPLATPHYQMRYCRLQESLCSGCCNAL